MSRTTDFLGQSTPIQELKHLAIQVAQTEATVLITGETGSGKEVLSRFIHANSKRSHLNFIPVNCGAIPAGILESELFGHEKGAFTGALQSRKGYFESADKGTIFLDEIGEMPLETQVKLLRVIETGEYQKVGSSETRYTDTRLIAATNRNLQQAVTEKNFREDFYYRLRSVELHIPPLRERGQDILILAEYFITRFEQQHGLLFEGFTSDASEILLRYSWPGNIRELKNLIESLLILEKGKQITSEILEKHLVQRNRDKGLVHDPERSEKNELSLIYNSLIQLHHEISDIRRLLLHREQNDTTERKPPLLLPPPVTELQSGTLPSTPPAETEPDVTGIMTLEELEKKTIADTLEMCKGNKRRTAKLLGINERTLYRKIGKYGIENDDRLQAPES